MNDIVQTFQGGQGTSEHSYYTYQENRDTTTQDMIGGVAKGVAQGAQSFEQLEKEARRQKKQDLSPLMEGASKLVEYLNNSPQEIDPSEKTDKIQQFYKEYGKVYSISDMNGSLEALGGKELISSAYEPYRDNASKFEQQQQYKRNLGYMINPNAADDKAAVASADTWLNNNLYVTNGINNYQQATTNDERAMTLNSLTPTLLKVNTVQINEEITQAGGLHNITSFQVENMKNANRQRLIASKLPGAYADYINDIQFYNIEKIAKANDKDKDLAIKQMENIEKAMQHPYTMRFLESMIPVYGKDLETGEQKEVGAISGALLKTAYDVLGKDNIPVFIEQVGGANFVRSLANKVASMSVGDNSTRWNTALAEDAAYLLQKSPKTTNDILYGNPKGSFLDQAGSQAGKDADKKLVNTVESAISAGAMITGERSMMVSAINKNKSSTVTDSMKTAKREGLDSFLDTMVKEYKEMFKTGIFSEDGLIPLVNPENGSVGLYEYAEGYARPWAAIRPAVGERDSGRSLFATLTGNVTKAGRFYQGENVNLVSALKELSRETGYPLKDVFNQFNSAVSRATGVHPKNIKQSIDMPNLPEPEFESDIRRKYGISKEVYDRAKAKKASENISVAPVSGKIEGETQVSGFELTEDASNGKQKAESIDIRLNLAQKHVDNLEEQLQKTPHITDEMDKEWVEAVKELRFAERLKESYERNVAKQMSKEKWESNKDLIRTNRDYIYSRYTSAKDKVDRLEEYLYNNTDDERMNDIYIEAVKELRFSERLKESFDKEYKKYSEM